MKICSKCGISKPLSEFALNYGKPRPQCQSCMRVYKRKSELKDNIKAMKNVRRQTRALIELGEIRKPSTCDRCNSATNINAHHLSYDQPHSNRDVIFLCEACHKLEH